VSFQSVKPRILVIRGGAIGDFILTLPAIHLLREAFPRAHLEILGYKHIVALAEERFYADATRSIEYGAMAGFFIPNSALAPDLIEYFAGFQQIVSYLYDPDGYFEGNLRRAGVKHLLPAYQPLDDAEHAARQLARPLQQLALYLEDHAPRVFPSPEDQQAATQFFEGHGGQRLIAIHPGSGSARKNWPVERWAELGRRLAVEIPGARRLLVGGEADAAQIQALAGAWRGDPVLIAQNLSLPHLAAILQRCQLFLGHDSGISHLAASVGTPCLLLFGPTDPAIWGPPHAGVCILEAPEGDLNRIEVEAVQRKVVELLGLEHGAEET
jgi:heptosyltransferase III